MSSQEPSPVRESDLRPGWRELRGIWVFVSVSVGTGLFWLAGREWIFAGCLFAVWLVMSWVAVRRRWVMHFATVVVASLPALLIGWFILNQTRVDRHRAELGRVEAWLHRAHAFPPPGVSRNAWKNHLVGVHNSLSNPLYRPQWVPTEKVRAFADYLDATNARDLASVEGLLGIIAHLEEICPTAAGYGPFETTRAEFPHVKPARLSVQSP